MNTIVKFVTHVHWINLLTSNIPIYLWHFFVFLFFSAPWMKNLFISASSVCACFSWTAYFYFLIARYVKPCLRSLSLFMLNLFSFVCYIYNISINSVYSVFQLNNDHRKYFIYYCGSIFNFVQKQNTLTKLSEVGMKQ